jgi:hypothetical protein
MNYTGEWKFAGEAYTGSGAFSDGTALEKFSRETDENFKRRKQSATREYENIFLSKVNRYVGYLFSRPPTRKTDSEVLGIIKDDIDGAGNDADVFFSSFSKNAKVRGVNLCLVESPQEISSNLKAQLENRELPYLVEILPERVVEYQLDKFGRFEFVAFSDTITTGGYGEQKSKEVTRYYDKSVWAIYDGKNIIESAAHGLAECPVMIFSESGKFESIGEFTQIAGMSKRLYNLASEIGLMLRSQTFSILTIWTEKGSKPDISLGTDNALHYSGDKPPMFISSDSSQAQTYETRIGKVREAIDRVAYDVTTGEASESGISLEIKFQGLNSSLNSFAKRLEDFEQRIWWVICQKVGLKEDSISVSYEANFSIKDVQSSLDVLTAINSIADLPQYKAAKLASIVKDDLRGVNSETLDIVVDEIVTNIAKFGE